jgi:uncharacterized protein (TIGR02246 family)
MKRILPVLVGWILVAGLAVAPAADTQDKRVDESSAVRAAVDAYVAAYNRGDAKAVAACWSRQGQWISPAGEKVQGPAAIEKALQAIFSEARGMHLELPHHSVRLIAPDVALDEGVARVVRPGEVPADSTYLAAYVKQDGQWKLDSVRETELPSPPSHYQRLKDLDWLIGDWVDQNASSTVATKVVWTKNKNFILSMFKVSAPGMDDLEGTQVIGWDPIEKSIRSWIFDSDGGYGEGTWTKKGNRWLVKTSTVLANGGRASATNIYRCLDNNTYAWQSIGRQVNGKHLPNIEEVKVVRKAGAPSQHPAAQATAKPAAKPQASKVPHSK